MIIKKFKFYLYDKNTLLKTQQITRHPLKSKIFKTSNNNNEIDFGHFRNFKINKSEISNYFTSNRILKYNSLKNDVSKLKLFFKEFTMEINPILKKKKLNIKKKSFNQTVESVKILRKSLFLKRLIKGRLIKKTKGGFLVSIQGFKAFLPNSQYYINKNSKDKKKNLFLKPILVRILAIKAIKYNFKYSKYKKPINYVLNILVSSKKPMKKLKKKAKDTI